MQMRRLGKEDGAMPGSRPPKPRGRMSEGERR